MENFISAKIKTLRQQKGYSQSDMAEKLHISQPAYQKIEKGETKIDVKRLLEIGEILDADVRELIIDKNKVINYNSDYSHSNGLHYNYHSADLKETQEKLHQSWQNERIHLMEEINFLRNQVEKLTTEIRTEKE